MLAQRLLLRYNVHVSYRKGDGRMRLNKFYIQDSKDCQSDLGYRKNFARLACVKFNAPKFQLGGVVFILSVGGEVQVTYLMIPQSGTNVNTFFKILHCLA